MLENLWELNLVDWLPKCNKFSIVQSMLFHFHISERQMNVMTRIL